MLVIGKGRYMNKRNKLLAINGLVTIIMQIVTMICGLILPRLILSAFGSDVNGLVTSITQFLSFISLLDGGLGGVIRAAYYKTMAEHNNESVSRVFAASNKFYRQIAGFFIIYIIFLAFIFPVVSGNQFGYLYTFLLVIFISLATIMQYLWGYSLKLLVFSDQRGYLHNFTQILTTIINTVISGIFIYFGAGIHIVKLVAAIAYVVQPLFLGIYVRKHYNINYKAKPDDNAIKQRWSALARHIAFYIHSNTDVVILTFFTTFSIVSIYSVYKTVVNGLTNLVAGVISNTEATFGDLLAAKEIELFKKEFKSVDLLSKMVSTVCFATCTTMICVFVNIYTRNVTDADYHRPIFALLICLSEWIYCMGLNYNNVIVSVGHFRQTTKIGIIEASINVVFSLILVKSTGLEGVVAATVPAMTYKMIANIVYMEKNIVHINIIYTFRSLFASTFTFLISIIVIAPRVSNINNYMMFFIEAGIVFIVIMVINVIVNLVFCKNETIYVLKKIKAKLRIISRNLE